MKMVLWMSCVFYNFLSGYISPPPPPPEKESRFLSVHPFGLQRHIVTTIIIQTIGINIDMGSFELCRSIYIMLNNHHILLYYLWLMTLIEHDLNSVSQNKLQTGKTPTSN